MDLATVLLSFPSTPSLLDVVLFLAGITIPVSIYLVGRLHNDVTMQHVGIAITAVFLLTLGGLALSGILSEDVLGMTPSNLLPGASMAEVISIILATTIPLAAYQVIQLTRVIQWSDVVVFIGLTLLPAAAILALMGAMSGAAVTGIIGILTAHSLGIIDTD